VALPASIRSIIPGFIVQGGDFTNGNGTVRLRAPIL
jgi:cyclophilin family peptidyl-prolyl cis-trans isomerase